jgi:hypothetical protein
VVVPMGDMTANGLCSVAVGLGSATYNRNLGTGPTSISVTSPVADALVARGEAVEAGSETDGLADGSERISRVIVIGSITIGGRTVNNVKTTVGNSNSMMLVGLNVLNQFDRFSIDTVGHKLVLVRRHERTERNLQSPARRHRRPARWALPRGREDPWAGEAGDGVRNPACVGRLQRHRYEGQAGLGSGREQPA